MVPQEDGLIVEGVIETFNGWRPGVSGVCRICPGTEPLAIGRGKVVLVLEVFKGNEGAGVVDALGTGADIWHPRAQVIRDLCHCPWSCHGRFKGMERIWAIWVLPEELFHLSQGLDSGGV